MYRVLYRAYRPEVFSQVLGQEHIVTTLRNQIASGDVSHAYLFCGTRGTGKTTIARLLAKGVNCTGEGEKPCGECENCKAIQNGSFIDLIEIDAASNNGVDNIRELRESVNYPPVSGKRKVYIIDEVHMLSTPAFNALLKTLEEPPEHVMFILATTEPQKLPATILSRCIRMDFRRVPEALITERIEKICLDMDVEMDHEAVKLIAANADGSARDALTLLDQCISGRRGGVSRDDVLESLGTVGEEKYIELTEAVLHHDQAGGLMLIGEFMNEGRDSRQILRGWMAHYRNLMMVKFIKDPVQVLNMSVENIERIRKQSTEISIDEISIGITEIAEYAADARESSQPRILLEMCFVRLAMPDDHAVYRKDDKIAPVKAAVGTVAKPEKKVAPAINADEIKEEKKEEKKQAAPAKEPPRQTDEETGDTDFDVALVWNKTMETACTEHGEMMLVKMAAHPTGAHGESMEVAVSSNMALDLLEKYKVYVEGLIEKYSGMHKRLIIKGEGHNTVEKEKTDIDAMREKASGILGIDVEKSK